MTDNMISTVGKMEIDRLNRAKWAEEIRTSSEKQGIARYASAAAPPPKGSAEVLLRFKVDPDSNEVTVLVVDKASRKVVRTIPPEELKNLNEGDLFELFT